MDNPVDLSDCINPKFNFMNNEKINPACAQKIGYDDYSYPLFKAIQPIRSYKITYSGFVPMLTTIIIPIDTNFVMRGNNIIKSEKVFVQDQQFCQPNIFYRLYTPTKTKSLNNGVYETNQYTYPDKFVGNHGIYSATSDYYEVAACFR